MSQKQKMRKSDLPNKDNGIHFFRAGCLALENKRFEEAIILFNRALTIFDAHTDFIEERLRTATNLGHALVAARNYESALSIFQKASEMANLLTLTTQEAWQAANMGSVYRDLKKYQNALLFYHRALALFIGENHTEGMAAQYANIGYIHAVLGEIITALDWFEKSANTFHRIGHLAQAANAEKNIRLLRNNLPKAWEIEEWPS